MQSRKRGGKIQVYSHENSIGSYFSKEPFVLFLDSGLFFTLLHLVRDLFCQGTGGAHPWVSDWSVRLHDSRLIGDCQ